MSQKTTAPLQIFEKYGIDFCCGGQSSLETVSRDKGLDPAEIINELETVKKSPSDRRENYGAWALSFLADYIVNTHHAWLNENTGQISAYAQKIAEVHGARHPEVIEIASLFAQIVVDLEDHLGEEENVLFPAVKRLEATRKAGAEPSEGDRAAILNSLEKLYREHETIGDIVHQIRDLANNYEIPKDACNTFTVTYKNLKEFEDDLHKHVHLENNILFLKAAHL